MTTSSENEHSIDPAPFAQSGATIDVTVQARVMDSLCDPMFASLTISGGWYDAVVYMYNAQCMYIHACIHVDVTCAISVILSSILCLLH